MRIQKHEDEIVFLGEPKMKIKTGTSLLYSNVELNTLRPLRESALVTARPGSQQR
jgi:hypothetical protein